MSKSKSCLSELVVVNDSRIDVAYVCPKVLLESLLASNQNYVRINIEPDLNVLDERCQISLSEVEKNIAKLKTFKNFDFIKMAHLPIFTTIRQRALFNEIEKRDCIEFGKEWAKVKLNGAAMSGQQLVAASLQRSMK